MTRSESALFRTAGLLAGWPVLSECLERFDREVAGGPGWFLPDLSGMRPPTIDVPADQFPQPDDDTLRRWFYAILGTAGWVITPRPPDDRSRAGYYRVTPGWGYGWDSLLKPDPKEVG